MTTSTTRKYTVLSSDEWRVVIEGYKMGTSTIAELSETYGVSPRSIQNKVKEAGATKRAGFTAVSASSSVAATMSVGAFTTLPTASSKPLTAAQRQKIAEDRIDQVIESAIVNALNIEHMTAQCQAVLAKPAATPDELNRAAATLRSMERAVMIFDRTDRIKRRALMMDTGNASVAIVLPELPIRDMTTDEMQAIRARQAQEDQGMQFDDDGTPIVELPADAMEDDDRIAQGCDDD